MRLQIAAADGITRNPGATNSPASSERARRGRPSSPWQEPLDLNLASGAPARLSPQEKPRDPVDSFDFGHRSATTPTLARAGLRLRIEACARLLEDWSRSWRAAVVSAFVPTGRCRR